ncbi:hypothetical protein Ciccas_011546 [Cichlidogyrus casuarinus]|uniref:Uncharacterized protein n=1 Tax=Cichlidogyrus casuarinus TaxID=1844966 RepID=A0ABD2PT21_9PLAT
MLLSLWLFLGLLIGSCEQCSFSFDVDTTADSYTLTPRLTFSYYFISYYKIELHFKSRPDLNAVFMRTQNREEYKKLTFKTCQKLDYTFVCFKDEKEKVTRQGVLSIPPTKQQIQVDTQPSWQDFNFAKIVFQFGDNQPNGSCDWQVCGNDECEKFTKNLTGRKSYGELFSFVLFLQNSQRDSPFITLTKPL